MGRIPPIVVVIIGIVLIGGICAGAFFVLIKPQQEELAELQDELEEEEAEAAEEDAVWAALVKAKKDREVFQLRLEDRQDTRSIPISFAQPLAAWGTLLREYRRTLAELIEEYVASTGCTIVTGVGLPSAPSVPPPAPPSGFLDLTEGGITLTVEGDLPSIEKLYRSLRTFRRVAVISDLSLSSSDGGTITAAVPFNIYLLAEVPPAPAAPAAGVGLAGMGMAPGMAGMGMPPGMIPPPMPAPGGAPGVGPPELEPTKRGT